MGLRYSWRRYGYEKLSFKEYNLAETYNHQAYEPFRTLKRLLVKAKLLLQSPILTNLN